MEHLQCLEYAWVSMYVLLHQKTLQVVFRVIYPSGNFTHSEQLLNMAIDIVSFPIEKEKKKHGDFLE